MARRVYSGFAGRGGPPRGGGGMGAPGGGGGGGMFEMSVPGHKVGLIIGKGGETIKQLQERSGAKIIIIQDSPGRLQRTSVPSSSRAYDRITDDQLKEHLGRRGWMQCQSKEKGPRYSPGELTPDEDVRVQDVQEKHSFCQSRSKWRQNKVLVQASQGCQETEGKNLFA